MFPVKKRFSVIYNVIMQVTVDIYIKSIRLKRKLTLVQLAKLSGVSKSHISEIENGKEMPSLQILCELAVALEVSPGDLYAYHIER